MESGGAGVGWVRARMWEGGIGYTHIKYFTASSCLMLESCERVCTLLVLGFYQPLEVYSLSKS